MLSVFLQKVVKEFRCKTIDPTLAKEMEISQIIFESASQQAARNMGDALNNTTYIWTQETIQTLDKVLPYAKKLWNTRVAERRKDKGA